MNFGWDLTSHVGRGIEMAADSSMIMECDGWELNKVWWDLESDNKDGEPIIWANHVACELSRPRNGHGKHFPRDNALVGSCTYCGAHCPDHFQSLFKMYNWKWVAEWSASIIKDGRGYTFRRDSDVG